MRRFQWIIFILSELIVMESTFRPTQAGDFAIIADVENGTIYAGSMRQRLIDLAPLPLIGVNSPVAVEYDPVEKMIYWTDVGLGPTPKISRAHLDGSNQVTLVDDLRDPYGLALDVVSRMMYWTDRGLGHIVRASMDGENKEIIVENLDQPTAIVTFHDAGHIYWTDWGDIPKIERADFSGRNRMTLIEGDLGWPTGIHVDYENNYLYWCDYLLSTIERSDLVGNNRTFVIEIPIDMNHTSLPYDLALYNDNLYWTDWAYLNVFRVHVNGLGFEVYSPPTFQRAAGIHIQKETYHCESSPCRNDATCVDVINGFSCQCPSGSNECSVVAGCDVVRDPSDVLLVEPDQTFFLPGNQAIFYCPDGFRLSGTAALICRSDNTWSGDPGECIHEVSGCNHDELPDLLIIKPEKTIYLPGDQVEYNCPSGYQIMGSTVRICRSDTTWSGEPADCIREVYGCVITNNRSDVLKIDPNKSTYLPGDQVEFDCPDGYELRGSTTQICQSDLKWSGELAECILKENEPLPVEAIIGGGVGGSILFIIVLFVVIIFKRRKTHNDEGRNVSQLATISSNLGPPGLIGTETCFDAPPRYTEYDNPDAVRYEPTYERCFPKTIDPANQAALHSLPPSKDVNAESSTYLEITD